MSVSAIIISGLAVGGTGILIGFILGIFGEKFKVEVDEREEAILEVLPGNNCGGCGYAGCSGLAAAIAKGEAPVNQCPVGGAPVAAKVGAIMGVEAGSGEHKVAFVKCAGTCDVAANKYHYVGEMDCRRAAMVAGRGEKACSYGCLGLGSCVEVCQFGALSIQNGVAKVDRDKCVACGQCVATCPNHVIDLIPYSSAYAVQCSSKDKGKAVMEVCQSGCIGCGLCVRQCEFGAVTLEDNIAVIDGTKCQGCGKCAEKCPKKVIHAQQ